MQLAAGFRIAPVQGRPKHLRPIGNKVYSIAASGDGSTNNLLDDRPDSGTITKYANSNSAGGGWGVCIWDTSPRYLPIRRA